MAPLWTSWLGRATYTSMAESSPRQFRSGFTAYACYSTSRPGAYVHLSRWCAEVTALRFSLWDRVQCRWFRVKLHLKDKRTKRATVWQTVAPQWRMSEREFMLRTRRSRGSVDRSHVWNSSSSVNISLSVRKPRCRSHYTSSDTYHCSIYINVDNKNLKVNKCKSTAVTVQQYGENGEILRAGKWK